MREAEIFLLDTNILVYAHDKTSGGKHEISKAMVERCLKDEKLAVSSQNLSEFFWVTTRKHFLNKKEAIDIISDIINFSGWLKISFDHNTVLEAARIAEEFSMPYWDSLLAATMRRNSIFNLYTENAKDFKMPWLNAANPFRK